MRYLFPYRLTFSSGRTLTDPGVLFGVIYPLYFIRGEGCRPAGRVCYKSILLRNYVIFVNRPAPCFGGETLSPYLSVFPPFSVSIIPREPGGKERGKEGKNGGS